MDYQVFLYTLRYWTSTNTNHPSISILFWTDNKPMSSSYSIKSSNLFNSISSSIFIQWIPGHSTIPGNDLANKAAKETATIVTDTIHPVSFSSSIQVINETIHDALPSRERVALIYQHRKASWDVKQINNRKDDALLARLRSGHHPFLMQYLDRIDPSQDPICPNCLLKVQDLLHWLCELLFWWP